MDHGVVSNHYSVENGVVDNDCNGMWGAIYGPRYLSSLNAIEYGDYFINRRRSSVNALEY